MGHSGENHLLPLGGKLKRDIRLMLVPQDNHGEMGLPRVRKLFLFGSIVLVGLVVASTVFVFTHINTGSPPSTKPFINEPSIVKASQPNVVTLLPKPTATTLSPSKTV